MTVRIGCGLSEHPEARVGAIEAATAARDALGGAPADLAMVFACGAHLAAPEATLEGVHEALAPAALAGCGAGGVVGSGREVEGGTAVSVWAATLGDGEAEPFHVAVQEAGDGFEVSGLPSPRGASAMVLLPDPYSFPTDRILTELARVGPGIPVLGGLSSARTLGGECALFCGDEVHAGGAVGVRFAGLEILPCVSQGAAPLGPALTITGVDGHVIHSLDDRPALECLREAIEELTADERDMLSGGLLLGIGVEGNGDGGTGEYLVRSLLGADPEAGTVAVGAAVRPGQVVRLHARNADAADRDLRAELGLRRTALGDTPAAGALMFTCNGRGRGMFGTADHDALALDAALAGAPAAGFFAAGEIGPVAGEPHLHGFTATIGVFAT